MWWSFGDGTSNSGGDNLSSHVPYRVDGRQYVVALARWVLEMILAASWVRETIAA